MFYRLALITATCVALTACSGSDESKTATTTNQLVTPTMDTTKPAEPQTSPPIPTASTNKAAVDPAACSYTVAELNQALGFAFKVVNAVDVPFAGGTQLSCLYSGEQRAAVTVTQLNMQDPKMLEGMEQYLASSLKPIPNDPDQAKWQTADGGSGSDLTLHYVRAGTSIAVTLVGVDQNEWPVMQEKLVALRRIP
ncbi:MAG TPA: hypothetical protein PLM98_04155 [Thiolinea sp.]|nr:hypothetical protein [Thiolinea sp.]